MKKLKGAFTHIKINPIIIILYHFISKGLPVPDYIGISKLCCPHCTIALKEYSIKPLFSKKEIEKADNEDAEEMDIFRGWHGHLAEWPISAALFNNAEFLEKFLDRELFDFYSTANDATHRYTYKSREFTKQQFYQYIIKNFCGLTSNQLKEIAKNYLKMHNQSDVSLLNGISVFKGRKGKEPADPSVDNNSTLSVGTKVCLCYLHQYTNERIDEKDIRFTKLKKAAHFRKEYQKAEMIKDESRMQAIMTQYEILKSDSPDLQFHNYTLIRVPLNESDNIVQSIDENIPFEEIAEVLNDSDEEKEVLPILFDKSYSI